MPGSLRHAARLETSWPGQWLRYLAAVVSIIQYLTKGAYCITVVTVGNRRGIAGATASITPPLSSAAYAPYLIGPWIIYDNNRAESQGWGVVSLGTPHSHAKRERFCPGIKFACI